MWHEGYVRVMWGSRGITWESLTYSFIEILSFWACSVVEFSINAVAETRTSTRDMFSWTDSSWVPSTSVINDNRSFGSFSSRWCVGGCDGTTAGSTGYPTWQGRSVITGSFKAKLLICMTHKMNDSPTTVSKYCPSGQVPTACSPFLQNLNWLQTFVPYL